jgi:hypothetical protein
LKDLDLAYDFRDRAQLENDLPREYETYKAFLQGMGVKRES